MKSSSKTITIRGLDLSLLNKLKKRSRSHGMSVNRFVLRKLQEELSVGIKGKNPQSEDPLRGFTGCLESELADKLSEKLQSMNSIDEDLWR